MRIEGLLASLVVLTASASVQAENGAGRGRLVIVGGALEPENAGVWGAFISGLPNPATDRIAVIASASGEPVASFEAARAALARHGVAAERVVLIRAAIVDDPATPADESDWADGGADPEMLSTIESAGGVWFTGGDQVRTARVLFEQDGAPSPLLIALRRRLAQGAVIGGSSAGAAIQGGTMILRGDGLIALTQPMASAASDAEMEDGRLRIAPGAGFFGHGIVDQHFDRQARLGRLARAVVESVADRFGYGIDENTALIVDTASRTATVAGVGTVSVLDDVDSRRRPGVAFAVEGLRLSVLSAGDRIDLQTGEATPSDDRARDAMRNRASLPNDRTGVGPGVPARPLIDTLDQALIGTAARTLDRISVGDAGGAVRFRFEKTGRTTAVSGRGPEDGIDDGVGLTIRDLRLSITPVRITIDEVTP